MQSCEMVTMYMFTKSTIVLVYIQLVYFVFVDNVRMANVILPFVASCGTPNVPATNLVTADYGPFTNEKDSGLASKRQKSLQLFVEIYQNIHQG